MTTTSELAPPLPAEAQLDHQLLVFSDDWGRHPSSCQHLVRQLLKRRHVVWFNTIGMRPPRLDAATLKRGLEKLRHWRPGRRAPGPNRGPAEAAPRVVNPLMWPSFASRWGRWLNRRLLKRAISRVLDPSKPATILTSIPVVADLVDAIPGARWVYYCVDDFSSWPGLDGETMGRMERKLVKRVDCVVAAGENLAERMRDMGRAAVVMPHGVDLEAWTHPSVPSVALPSLEFPRPLIMFWGLIDQRLDLTLLRALSERLQDGTIVLVGPEQNPPEGLAKLRNVVRLGAQPFAVLPSLAQQASVLIMPYADLPVTRAMQPLKLKEYLATGKPVVIRDLPGTADWNDCLDACREESEFTRLVLQRLETGIPFDQAQARRRLDREGWRSKAIQLETLLFPVGTGSSPDAG